MRNLLRNIMTAEEQRVMLGFCALLLLGMGLNIFGWQPLEAKDNAKKKTEIEKATKTDTKLMIDIRTANQSQLESLPGIGPKRAKDIIIYRTDNQFAKTSDLLNIPGIGEKTFNKMRPNLVIFGEDVKENSSVNKDKELSSAKDSLLILKDNAHSKTKDKTSKSAVININTASKSELMSLKGIGEVKAQAIIDYRNENGNFDSIEQIMDVSGIGPKTFEKIRTRLKV